jgi:threonine/homoserine/homoserine lactone efflux protein
MFDAQVLQFVLVAAVLTATPGADTMLVVRSVLRRGKQAGFATTFGVCVGLFVHATVSALGLSVLLVRSAWAFNVVRWAGVAYLLFLGVQSLVRLMRSDNPEPEVQLEPSAVTPAAIPAAMTVSENVTTTVAQTGQAAHEHAALDFLKQRQAFLEGLLTNILNPKVAVFYLAFLPQFISPGDPVLAKSLLLAGLHFTMGMMWLSLVTVLLGRLGKVVSNGRTGRWLEGVAGVVLIGFGVRLALEQR